jgi:hypothetical protein
LITYTFVQSKDWAKLQLTVFSSNTLSSIYYISMRFLVLTAAFQRIQVVVWVVPDVSKVGTAALRNVGNHSPKTQHIVPENLSPHFTTSLHVNVS